MNAELCSHCLLPVGHRVHQRDIDGEPEHFCCYGCCLAFQVRHGKTEEAAATGLLIRLGIGGFLAMNIMLFSLLLYSGSIAVQEAELVRAVHFILLLLATPVLIILGWPFVRGAGLAVLGGRMTADTLIAIGALSAYGYSAYMTLSGGQQVYFDTVTMVLVLFTLGRYLEATGRARALRNLQPLLASEQGRAQVVDKGVEVSRPVKDLQPGMLVRVLPGERVPVDGVVREGYSRVDESMLTGESRPVNKALGDSVLAGTLNQEGCLLVECCGAVSASRWAQICRSVRHALASETPLQGLADRIAAGFVPGVLLAAGLTTLYWAQQGPFGDALLSGLAVLVVACPCALGLATPLATSLGLGQALCRGCLIRGGSVLERLAQVRTVAFDKTGTLTRGDVSLAGICSDAAADEELLRFAAGLEQGSEHPLAQGILAASRTRGVTPYRASRVRALPGRGVMGLVGSQLTAVGSARLMRQLHWQMSASLEEEVHRLDDKGHTLAYVGWVGVVQGVLVLDDILSAEAARSVAQLRQLGLNTVMLTGDMSSSAERIARSVGLDSYRAGLSPEDKQAVVAELTQKKGSVAMVGDGLNDAPVLATAAVGIAVGSATDLARETADLVLPEGGVGDLPWLVTLARRVRRTIRTNLLWAFGYNFIALTLAALGVLPPVLAAGLMAGSSLLVVINSLRLERFSASGEFPSGEARVLANH